MTSLESMAASATAALAAIVLLGALAGARADDLQLPGQQRAPGAVNPDVTQENIQADGLRQWLDQARAAPACLHRQFEARAIARMGVARKAVRLPRGSLGS